MFQIRGVSILFTIGLLPAHAQSAYSQLNSDEQQLVELDRQWCDAEVKHDEAVLNRILDDRFLVVSASGQVTKGKAAFIQMVRKFTFTSYTVLHDHIQIHGDTAIVVAQLTTRTQDGIDSAPVRCTVTYVRQQGRWRAIAETFGRMSSTQ